MTASLKIIVLKLTCLSSFGFSFYVFVKRDCFGGMGQRVGDFFCNCKINGCALDSKKKKKRIKASNITQNLPPIHPYFLRKTISKYET